MRKCKADNTSESGIVKEETFTKDTDLDSLPRKVVTVEKNHLEEVSSLISMAKEEKGTPHSATTDNMLARNLMIGLTDTLKAIKYLKKEKNM